VVLSASGGIAPYEWSESSGILVPKMGVSVNYTLPKAVGDYTVTLTDGGGTNATATVKVYSVLLITPQVDTVDIGTTKTFYISGGKEPYQVTCTNGLIGNVDAGNFTFTAPKREGIITLTVKDSINQTISASIRVIKTTLLTLSPTTATLRPSEHLELTASGGKSGYTWTTTAGQLLANEGEKITYVASDVAGDATITVTDTVGTQVVCVVTVTLNLSLSPQIVVAQMENLHGIPFFALGGAFPYIWKVTNGTIQPDNEGVKAVFMPPAIEGEFQVTVQDGRESYAMALVRVVSVPKITPAQVVMTVNETKQFSVVGGKSPYKWTTESGDLSQIDGNVVTYIPPLKNGLYLVTVIDAAGNQAKAMVNVVVGNLIISPIKAIVGINEDVSFAVARGIEPYTWQDLKIGRTWTNSYDKVGRYEVVVVDAVGSLALAVVDVIRKELILTPEKVVLHPGEVANFFVSGGTDPYAWAAEAGSLSNLDGDHVGYIAPDEPGIYEITVNDGRDIQGKAVVEVSASLSGVNGEIMLNRGYIQSGIVIDGIPRKEDKIFSDQEGTVGFNFSVTIENDNNDKKYNVYAMAIYFPPPEMADLGMMLIFRTGNPDSPLEIYTGGELPVYTLAEAGSSVLVTFYEGPIKGLSGILDFYVGYSSEKESWENALLFNPKPFSVEIK
ncbi:MAG: hypothetical protein HQK77_11745, partial [Desulfobacterales bacterium]|nr:hypothetical protein [Desulfobacterales bacterium]